MSGYSFPVHEHKCGECGCTYECRGFPADEQSGIPEYNCEYMFMSTCDICLKKKAFRLEKLVSDGGYLTPEQTDRFIGYCVDYVWLEVCSEISEGMGLCGLVLYLKPGMPHLLILRDSDGNRVRVV